MHIILKLPLKIIAIVWSDSKKIIRPNRFQCNQVIKVGIHQFYFSYSFKISMIQQERKKKWEKCFCCLLSPSSWTVCGFKLFFFLISTMFQMLRLHHEISDLPGRESIMLFVIPALFFFPWVLPKWIHLVVGSSSEEFIFKVAK